MENVENKLVKISVLTMVISIVLVLIVMFVFAKPVFVLALAVLYMSNLQSILLLVSGLIIIAGAVYITYRYLLYMINHFKTKKIKTIFMAIIPIVLLTILGIIYKTEETFSLVIGIPSIYIFTVIVIPIIVIGMILLRDMKTIKKVIAATIIAILTIGIYIIHYPYLKLCAEELSLDIEQFIETKTGSKQEIDGQSTEYNLVYLENYKQKMEKEGFLDKYNILNILKLADNRTDNIHVHYTEGTEELQFNNEDNQLVEELGPKLQANTYKFSYTHKNEQTDIYIEKYETNTSESEEKNADIFLTVEPNYNVTNTKADFENEDDVNFLIENRINLEKGTDSTINNLRIVFAYDAERHNYIPHVDDEQLRKIESYKIYSSGMSITLKEGVTLAKKDYTLRINRYNEYLVVDEDKEPFYYYKYEPIATETRNSNGNTVIEISFDNTYALGDLKNIEIIF